MGSASADVAAVKGMASAEGSFPNRRAARSLPSAGRGRSTALQLGSRADPFLERVTHASVVSRGLEALPLSGSRTPPVPADSDAR